MGKGSQPTKLNVKKSIGSMESAGEGGVAEGGPDRERDLCLVRFREYLQFNDVTGPVGPGFNFMLSLDTRGNLVIVSNGNIVGAYMGDKRELLEPCINAGYMYKGVVKSVTGNVIDCEITGMRPTNGPAKTR